MKIKIKVTKKHIKDGGGCVINCPIALAAREIGLELDVYGEQYASVWDSDTWKRTYYDLPRSARRFIKRFDSDKKVKPFNFILIKK